MPKRKRSEPSLKDKLDKSHEDVFKALKIAKGWERQRLSKRFHDADITADKKERLEREITVLKSLDLQQTALAHLYSSLLKVKSIAASTDLPDEVRAGVPKPELSEQEKAALHNVTSGLYNRDNVKQAIERAVNATCASLNVPPPSKGKRLRKKDFEKNTEADGQAENASSGAADGKQEPEQEPEQTAEAWDEDTDFDGFSSDIDQPGSALGEPESDEEDDEEAEVSKYDHLLGASSDEEEDFDEELLEKYRGKETVNLDDISVSGSASEAESGEESDEEAEGSAASSDRSPSPPVKKAKSSSDDKKRKKSQAVATARDSTFLPSLMGGYISGSESASDVDVAPPKKRRGQRARQAIWEKKFGAKAKHLQNENNNGKGGRDQGWDMRRGAVDGEDGGRRTPWKKGIQNPLMSNQDTQGSEQRPAPKPTKRDDEGPLHPSWEARKKAKDSEKAVAFTGQKITFD